MNRKRKRLQIAILFLCVLLLTSCESAGKNEDEGTPEKESALRIGLSFDSFVIERWLRDRDVFVSTAKELGAEVNVQNANGDLNQQISQIDYFIQKDMDVIVVVAVDSKGLTDEIKKAKKAGIRVVAYDRLIKDADVDLFISFDNNKVGEMMAQTLVDQVEPGGKIFVINGSPADNNVEMLRSGFMEVMRRSDLRVVYTAYCENWTAELAFTYTQAALKGVRDVGGIMCGNDDLAGQSFRALVENRLAGKVVLVGQDAELSACQRIVEGGQAMTVYKPVDELARQAAEQSVHLGKGEKIVFPVATPGEAAVRETTSGEAPGGADAQSHTIDDGTYLVPYISLEPIAVTRENIDEVIIDSGFHTHEEVYLNIE